MRFFRCTRFLIYSLAVLIPAAGRPIQQASPSSAADLIEKVQNDRIVLKYDDQQGYLRAILKQLNVPISSQTLVFSKSSFQLSQIGPDSPRAVYFNDDVYVGWVNHGQFIEIAEVDPQNGPT